MGAFGLMSDLLFLSSSPVYLGQLPPWFEFLHPCLCLILPHTDQLSPHGLLCPLFSRPTTFSSLPPGLFISSWTFFLRAEIEIKILISSLWSPVQLPRPVEGVGIWLQHIPVNPNPVREEWALAQLGGVFYGLLLLLLHCQTFGGNRGSIIYKVVMKLPLKYFHT